MIKEPRRTTIEIETNNIKIRDQYFTFDYSVNVNGKEKIAGIYNDTFSISKQAMKKALDEEMYAEQLILENYTSEIFGEE